MLRVWALYDKSKRVGALLGTLFVVALASSFALRKIHPQVNVLFTFFHLSLTSVGTQDLHLAPIREELRTYSFRQNSYIRQNLTALLNAIDLLQRSIFGFILLESSSRSVH
jgi:hypothetical protein